jgi:hypothetical protein
MSENRRKKAVAQPDATRGWRPKTHAQEGQRPQDQDTSGSDRPRPPDGGSGVSPPKQNPGGSK